MMRHSHRHGFGGPPPWMAGPWFGPPWAGMRKRMRRGDVRTALLSALAEGPAHGYELMRSLEEKSGGAWSPSPGSIYPTLQLLEDEGLVKSQERDGKRVYELTDAGRQEAAARAQRASGAPWGADDDAGGIMPLREAAFQLAGAAMQVAQAGKTEQVERAEAVLRDARKQLYQILAEE